VKAVAKPVVLLGERSGTGLVTAVEDNGYPIYTITVHFEGAEAETALTANAADVDLGASAQKLKGKKVFVRYLDRAEPDLMEMLGDEQSLLAEEEPRDIDPAWKEVTGTLQGAAEVSHGDLPDRIAVVPSDGPKVEFNYFITEDMARANGKTVTAYYGMRNWNRIIAIKPE
jgi:hypothetical protein